MSKVFGDTSAIYAFTNRADPDHDAVRRFIEQYKGKIIVTNYIFDETVTLVNARSGHAPAVAVGNILRNSPQIETQWVMPEDERSAWELFVKRADKGYSFTDCTSFVIMRKLQMILYMALDDHFRQEGFESVLYVKK